MKCVNLDILKQEAEIQLLSLQYLTELIRRSKRNGKGFSSVLTALMNEKLECKIDTRSEAKDCHCMPLTTKMPLMCIMLRNSWTLLTTKTCLFAVAP